ncbi:GHKL domain-containing protein [Enterococcus sp. LJL120]
MAYASILRLTVIIQLFMLIRCDFQKIVNKRQTILLCLCLLYVFLISFLSIAICQLSIVLYTLFRFCIIKQSFQSWLPSAFSFLRNSLTLSITWLLTYDLPRYFLGTEFYQNKLIFLILVISQLILLTLISFLANSIYKRLNLRRLFSEIKKKYTHFAIGSLLVYGSLFMLNQYYLYTLAYSAILLSFFLLVVCSLFLAAFMVILATLYSSEQQKSYLNTSIVSINQSYNQMQNFRHGYKNILISLSHYLEKDELTNAKSYLQEIIQYSNKIIDTDNYSLLTNLNNYPLQALLISFINKLEESPFQIDFNLSVEEADYKIFFELIDLVRCLSILLDNAFESIDPREKNLITLQIYRKEKRTIFELKNTVFEDISVTSTLKKNFSTKKGHSGRGLYSLNQIISDYSNMDFQIEIVDKMFCTKILLETGY